MATPKRLPAGISPYKASDGTITWKIRTRIRGEIYHKAGFTKPELAIAHLESVKAEPVRHLSDVASVTVGDAARAYLETQAARWKPRTRRRYGFDWQAMADTFDTTPIVDLTALDVQVWLDESVAAAGPKGIGTIRNRLGLLRQLLDYAMLGPVGRVVKGNVAKSAKLHAAPREYRVYAPEASDVIALIDALDDRYRIVGWLSFLLGLRNGEARGLLYSDVVKDVSGGARITINWQTNHDETGARYLDTPKAGSRGVIYANDFLVAKIDAHVERYGLGPNGEIVTSIQGAEMSYNSWDSARRRAVAKSGVRLTAHQLRHARACFAAAAGQTAVEIARDLRNSPATAERYYIHAPAEPTSTGVDAAMRAIAPTARTARARRGLRAV